MKSHYIITKSHQDRVHHKNVTTHGQTLSVEQGSFQVYQRNIWVSCRYKIRRKNLEENLTMHISLNQGKKSKEKGFGDPCVKRLENC